MHDYYMVCTRCKVEKHVWSGNNAPIIDSTIPAEFSERHFKKGCSFKDLHFYGDQSELFENLDIENNYTDDESKYDDEFWD